MIENSFETYIDLFIFYILRYQLCNFYDKKQLSLELKHKYIHM